MIQQMQNALNVQQIKNTSVNRIISKQFEARKDIIIAIDQV